jgi:hypothetical protein
LLPITVKDLSESKDQNIIFKEAWIFNTGNMVITNNDLLFRNKLFSSKQLICEEGYSPFNLEISQIKMELVDNLMKWIENIETN